MNQRVLEAPPLPPGRARLVVTGFVGTGKTAAGRHAASKLGLPFFDLDEVVEERAGMAVSEIFARSGEEAFRAMERQVLTDATRVSGSVIATGGGASLHSAEWVPLADGQVAVVLEAEADEIGRRLAGDAARPLLEPFPPQRIGALLAARMDAYAAAGHAIATDGLDPVAVGDRLVDRYRLLAGDPSAPLEIVVGGEAGTRVLVGDRALDRAGPFWAQALDGSTAAVIVADQVVQDGTAARVAAELESLGLRTDLIPIPGGEQAKSVQQLAWLWERFRESSLDRMGTVVAVGGGTILDIAGLAAATYARGVSLVNVPTTLLAMVDASLGGKVGLNHGGVKNLAGAFHHPGLVVVDTATAASPSVAATLAGWAEVIKVGMVASPLILDLIADSRSEGISHQLGWLIEQAVRIKAGYVAKDPFDRGIRVALNLGHTFAHAIEAASRYEISHGEAVAIGLVAATRLGQDVGVTPDGLEARLSDLLARVGLPVECPSLSNDDLLAAMQLDKKRRAGRGVFIVPGDGGAVLLDGVDARAALVALYPKGGT